MGPQSIASDEDADCFRHLIRLGLFTAAHFEANRHGGNRACSGV